MNKFSYDSPVGRIWIAEKDNKITEVSTLQIQGEEHETPVIKETARQLEEYFAGKRKDFDIPVSPKGTDFQKQVWKALTEIPYGKVATYKDIAEKIGNSKACRAVGNANNKNPIMIIVPCHRVIGSNGDLTGYAGGLDMKRRLLELEK